MNLQIKTLSFLIDIDSYCNFNDLKNAKIYACRTILNDLKAIKLNIKHYRTVEIIEKDDCVNTINNQNAFEYFLKGHLPFNGCHLTFFDNAELPFNINNKFIYVEDFSDLDFLENLSGKYDSTIFSTKSFNKRSKKTFSYKGELNIIQKIYLIKNSEFYIGYDYSDLAPLAKIILKNNTMIHRSGKLSDEELMFRYINENNIKFFV